VLPVKTKLVRETLLVALENSFSDQGFILKKTKQLLIQKTDYGFNSIGISVMGYFPVYVKTGLVFSVRHDIVEDLLSKFIDKRFGNYTKSGIKEWATINDRVSFDNHYTNWDFNEWIKDF